MYQFSSFQLQNCGLANKGMWEIARKHESYEATEIVLKEVLATLRLDFTDRYAVKEMAVFMFLYLGNNSYIFYCYSIFPYFLQLRTWHRIVCWFLCFDKFLHDVIIKLCFLVCRTILWSHRAKTSKKRVKPQKSTNNPMSSFGLIE